jgi:hypothetical protein
MSKFPKVRFVASDGGETVAATPSIGLLHWYMGIIPHKPMPDPPPLPPAVVVASQPIPGPYHRMFLPTVVAGVERTYGNAPKVPQEMFDKDWYDGLPDNVGNHNVTLQALKDQHPKVMLYEAACWNILKWLERSGEIKGLERV